MGEPTIAEAIKPEKKRRAPTLYAIIAIKVGKGVLLLLVGLGVYSLSDNNLPQEFRELLRFFHFDPEKKFFTSLALKISRITPANVIWIARGAVLYSVFSLFESVGLFLRISWVGWLAICESLFLFRLKSMS